jgi:hypothetical protein
MPFSRNGPRWRLPQALLDRQHEGRRRGARSCGTPRRTGHQRSDRDFVAERRQNVHSSVSERPACIRTCSLLVGPLLRFVGLGLRTRLVGFGFLGGNLTLRIRLVLLGLTLAL